jgi:endonuclease YncB( thermonuclease family)
MRSALPWLALAAAAAALLIGRGRDSSTPARGSTLHARVLRVVDGDTIQVRLDGGRVERVRYIGIDTPESVKPDTPVQCFAKKASHFNCGWMPSSATATAASWPTCTPAPRSSTACWSRAATRGR